PAQAHPRGGLLSAKFLGEHLIFLLWRVRRGAGHRRIAVLPKRQPALLRRFAPDQAAPHANHQCKRKLPLDAHNRTSVYAPDQRSRTHLSVDFRLRSFRELARGRELLTPGVRRAVGDRKCGLSRKRHAAPSSSSSPVLPLL